MEFPGDGADTLLLDEVCSSDSFLFFHLDHLLTSTINGWPHMIAENVRWAYFQLSKFGWVGSIYFSKNIGFRS